MRLFPTLRVWQAKDERMEVAGILSYCKVDVQRRWEEKGERFDDVQ